MAKTDKEYFTFGGILENLNPDDDRDVIDISYFISKSVWNATK